MVYIDDLSIYKGVDSRKKRDVLHQRSRNAKKEKISSVLSMHYITSSEWQTCM